MESKAADNSLKETISEKFNSARHTSQQIEQNTLDNVREMSPIVAEKYTQAKNWAKANPALAAAIGLGTIALVRAIGFRRVLSLGISTGIVGFVINANNRVRDTNNLPSDTVH